MGRLKAEFFPDFRLFILEREDSPSGPQPCAQFVPLKGLER